MNEVQELELRKLFFKTVKEYFELEFPNIPGMVFENINYELSDKIFEAYANKKRLDSDRASHGGNA